MRLDDDVKSASAYKAVGAWEGEAGSSHHFGDADCC